MEGIQGAGRETQEIDWEDVHQRMSAADAVVEELGELTPETLEQIWARRAAALAKPQEQAGEGTQVQLLLIELGRELYGLEAKYVLEIRPVERLTHVPRVPNWVAGVANLRGRILSVIDLRRLFGLSAPGGDPGQGHWSLDALSEALGEEARTLVVVETAKMEVAFLVDEVLDVCTLPASQIRDSVDVVRGLPPEYVRGLAEGLGSNGQGSRDEAASLTVVLDLPAMLADKRLVIHEEIV
jgi:purine-binding chemotaxis protein CheW